MANNPMTNPLNDSRNPNIISIKMDSRNPNSPVFPHLFGDFTFLEKYLKGKPFGAFVAEKRKEFNLPPQPSSERIVTIPKQDSYNVSIFDTHADRWSVEAGISTWFEDIVEGKRSYLTFHGDDCDALPEYSDDGPIIRPLTDVEAQKMHANNLAFKNEKGFMLLAYPDNSVRILAQVPEKIFDRFGLIPYLPEGNTGVVVLGRRDDPFCPSSVEEFSSQNDPEYRQFYKMFDDWVALLQESPEDFKSFQETAKRYGATISDPSVLVGHPKIEAIPRAMEMYSDWSFSRQAKIPITTGKKINADRWHNTGISRLVDSDNEKPSAQGLIMQLGDMAYWVDYSSNGSTVIFLNQKIDNIGRLCQAELDLDKDEKIFKGKAGNGKLENFVTDYLKGESVAGTRVSLIRKDNSPIVFVPLISDAIISMGHISPVTKEQQSTLYIKY